MTATNHALTGAFIGIAIGNPWIAIPAALLSHFVCDAIPHFGVKKLRHEWVGSTTFRKFLTFDACLCVILVLVLAFLRPEHWLLASFTAFMATSPDLMWIKGFVRDQKHQKQIPVKKWNMLMKFHKTIQWFERPAGAITELLWVPAMLLLIWAIVA